MGLSGSAWADSRCVIRWDVLGDRDRLRLTNNAFENRTGPFSHLEMQEWYSNGYFTLDLPIKHVDAPTFEPLARFLARYGEISPFKDEAEEYVQRVGSQNSCARWKGKED